MNHLRKSSAVKKYKDTPIEEQPAALAADDSAYTPEEIAEIMDAIKAGPADEKPKPVSPNDNLDLSGFGYDNLTGESFEKYQKLADGLSAFAHYDFEQYMASGVFEKKHDRNLDKVSVLVGIKKNGVKPINTSRMPMSAARDLNAQIYNGDNTDRNSRYYLLKKPA